jgi:murein DD-endopeptidase MepM/ murein hydrolase activator NlpD
MKQVEYNIVIFPGETSAPRRFTIRRRTVRVVLGLSFVAALMEIAFLIQYVSRSGEIWELQALRSEVLEHRQQATALSSATEDIRKQLSLMREVNTRLRVMLGLEPPKPTHTAPGIGGKEESDTPPPHDASSFQESVSHLQHKLDWLKGEAIDQERHMEELAKIAGDRKAQWAATPSIWPVRGWVSSRFGRRISPFTGRDTMHGGIDISAPMLSPVVAPAAGTVIAVQFDAGLGNTVLLSHGYGLRTTYGHLAKFTVKAGQSVMRNQIIGWVGSTGLSTGPHLHYEVEQNGAGVDPLKYIID